MFDPHSMYSRRMWHYESSGPLSVAQLVAMGSLDAPTAGLLWLLMERHHSLIVSGPTDPTPGVGKTTTLNALLGLIPNGSTLVYTTGMYEDFDWVDEVPPETTYVLANEVSDHLSIYMWGRNARTLLKLPEKGFAVATSCHADTVGDVLEMLGRDLRLPASDIARLGVIVNIGLVGRLWPPRRRFLSVYLLRPLAPDEKPAPELTPEAARAVARYGVALLPLVRWSANGDSFQPPSPEARTALAGMLGMTSEALDATLADRCSRVEALAQGRGVGLHAMREAVEEFYEQQASVSATAASAPAPAVPPSPTDDDAGNAGK